MTLDEASEGIQHIKRIAFRVYNYMYNGKPLQAKQNDCVQEAVFM